MPIHIRFARSATERDAVYRLRATLVRDLSSPPAEHDAGPVTLETLMDCRRQAPRKLDRFDAYPTSMSFLALDGSLPVGTLRAVLHSPAGLPLSTCAPASNEERPVLLDWLHLHQGYLGSTSVLFGLLKVSTRWARRLGATRIYVHSPEFARLTLEKIGFREELTPSLYSVEVAALRASFLEPPGDGYRGRLVQDCDRSIFRRGEFLFRRGGVADSVYVIARGRVKLIGRSPTGEPVTITELGPGDLLGEEIGGDDHAKRWVDAVADAREVDVWTRPAEEFLQQLEVDSDLRRAFHLALTVRIQTLASFHPAHRRQQIARSLLDILLDLSARFSTRDARAPIYLSCCTSQWLAEQLGCREELVEQELDALAAGGLVVVQRGLVTVLDVQGLTAIHPEMTPKNGQETMLEAALQSATPASAAPQSAAPGSTAPGPETVEGTVAGLTERETDPTGHHLSV